MIYLRLKNVKLKHKSLYFIVHNPYLRSPKGRKDTLAVWRSNGRSALLSVWPINFVDEKVTPYSCVRVVWQSTSEFRRINYLPKSRSVSFSSLSERHQNHKNKECKWSRRVQTEPLRVCLNHCWDKATFLGTSLRKSSFLKLYC